MGKRFDVTKHILVPKHTKLSTGEKETLFKKYNISSIKQLPKISKKDPAVKYLGVKVGDVVRIERKSPTTGKSIFYRGVVDE